MTRHGAWQPPAWYAYPAGRLLFLTELRSCGVRARQTPVRRSERAHRGGFQAEFDLTVPGLSPRHVRIVFAGQGAVRPFTPTVPGTHLTATPTARCASGIP
jgi:hypothetical protein